VLRKVTLPAERVAITISLGESHTAVLLDNGSVYVSGNNFYGLAF